VSERTSAASPEWLDGNAAAGLLTEIFGRDVTTANATCSGCGEVRSIGELHLYGHEMGAVLRCAGCDAVLLRVVRTTSRLWLDASGSQSIAIPAEPAPNGLVSAL
jgi:Family of unknown function (DUF6510)